MERSKNEKKNLIKEIVYIIIKKNISIFERSVESEVQVAVLMSGVVGGVEVVVRGVPNIRVVGELIHELLLMRVGAEHLLLLGESGVVVLS